MHPRSVRSPSLPIDCFSLVWFLSRLNIDMFYLGKKISFVRRFRNCQFRPLPLHEETKPERKERCFGIIPRWRQLCQPMNAEFNWGRSGNEKIKSSWKQIRFTANLRRDTRADGTRKVPYFMEGDATVFVCLHLHSSELFISSTELCGSVQMYYVYYAR